MFGVIDGFDDEEVVMAPRRPRPLHNVTTSSVWASVLDPSSPDLPSLPAASGAALAEPWESLQRSVCAAAASYRCGDFVAVLRAPSVAPLFAPVEAD